MALDYSEFGGTLVTPDHPLAYALIGDPSLTEPVWNFGRLHPLSIASLASSRGKALTMPRADWLPSFYDQSPHLKGAGEGKAVILPHFAKKLFGSFLRSQYQPRGTCFVAGTLVTLADGTRKPIESFVGGEEVVTHLNRAKKVVRPTTRLYDGRLITVRDYHDHSPAVTATADHRFMNVAGEWHALEMMLRLGDQVVLDGEPAELREVGNREAAGQWVHCLEVEEDHSFVAGGFTVHNCVSRGAARAVNNTQVLAIYCGEPFRFDYVSHAYIYGCCREYGNDLSYQDGAVGEWAAWAVHNCGNVLNTDVNDDDNKDDLAVEWGAKGVPKDIKARAKDQGHLVMEIVPIRSFEEARDFLCSGQGAITVASNVGYEGSRNSDGVVRARGNWSHQMEFSGYRPDLSARGALLQEQSWGPDQPGGPLGNIEIPSFSWWTVADDCDRQFRERDAFGYKWVRGWDAPDLTYRP